MEIRQSMQIETDQLSEMIFPASEKIHWWNVGKNQICQQERSPIPQGVRLDWVAASAEISESQKKKKMATKLPLRSEDVKGLERNRNSWTN